MKKLLLLGLFLVFSVFVFAQTKFDLGIKGGVNFSDIVFDMDDLATEPVVKSHIGAFSRFGWNRLFIQPELYFSKKGGEINSNIFSDVASFDYSTFDLPVLLGFNLIKSKVFDFHITGGPVLSGIVSKKISPGDFFDTSFYKDHYFGVQYGAGIDILFLTLDARMENGLGKFYAQPNTTGKNKTFMVSIGLKIL